MGVKYVKVEGRKAECPCSITTEKGILWEYVDDNYRHFQTLCGPCAEDLFGDINMFKLPVLTPEQITERRPENHVLGMLANLARRVTSLESQLRDTQRNSEMLAEELMALKYLTQSNEGDIRMIDQRTQVIDAINKYYAEGSR